MTDDRTPKSSDEMLAEIREWLTEGRDEPARDRDTPAVPESADPVVSDEAPPPEPRPTAVPTAVPAPVAPPARRRRERRAPAEASVPAPPQRRSSWDGMGPWMILGIAFATLGTILIVWGATQFADTASWVESTGTVVAVDRDDDSISVQVEYVVDGRTYSIMSSAEDSARVGDVFEIAVHPDDPTQATTQRDRAIALVLRLVFGVLAILAAFVSIWWGRRLRRVDRY